MEPVYYMAAYIIGSTIILIELFVIVCFVVKVMDAAMFISDKFVDFCLSFIIKE